MNDLAPPLVLDDGALGSLDALLAREWLETNGLGSFACGTVAGAATRRYHALLCVATRPPLGRVVLANLLEEELDDGERRTPLSTFVYQGGPRGIVHPRGVDALAGFRLDPWPTWRFTVGNITVEREIWMPHGVQATVVRWRVTGGRAQLRARPLVSGRDYHALHHENGALRPDVEARAGVATVRPYPGVPALHLHHDGRFDAAPDWYRRFELAVERARGFPSTEDLFTPGVITFEVPDGGSAQLVLTTEARDSFDLKLLEADERRHRAAVVSRFVAAHPGADERARRLALAADQFIVARGGGATVIAGYPWFTDWGRDTFISLPGLALTTGRREIARQLLTAFAPHVSQGMIPNRFPDPRDADEAPEYNTVDASLWYVIAAGQYLTAAARAVDVKPADLRVLWPAVRAIVDGYRAGTRYGIHVDGDGLVGAGAPGVQLTWMDARIDDLVVTPRRGKPIEIQALWIRALAAARALASTVGEEPWAADTERVEAAARAALGRRFAGRAEWLLDVVDAEPDGVVGASGDDARLRPNQLYALALAPSPFDADTAARALAAVERALLTPLGLRTLAPDDPAYRGRCDGSPLARDTAYHQGTVWPHLLGVYADAVWRVRRERVGPRIAAAFAHHLGDAGVGQVSEIFDGDAPHAPRGCFAQAWAVAELLRIAVTEPASADLDSGALGGTIELRCIH